MHNLKSLRTGCKSRYAAYIFLSTLIAFTLVLSACIGMIPAYANSSSDNYEPPESFRYSNGEPIVTYEANNIGTTYPNTFVTYDSGNHTRSDALHGIDVSYYQGTIDWARVKAAGIDFAIIRSSDGFTYNDSQFVNNVKGCINNSIPFGVYHYARATNAEEANIEADHVFNRLNAAGVTPGNITYPIYYDIENSGTPNYWDLGQGTVETIARTFIGRMNAAGYNAGVYSSTSSYDGGPCGSSYINSLEYRWCAQYNSAGLKYNGFGTGGDSLMNNGKGMWQFSSHGLVDGISGYVDLDYSYYNKLSAVADVSITNIDKDAGTFRVVANNITSNQTVASVSIAVWCSSTGGQDDLKWYSATKASDGSYYVDVSIKDHKSYVGTYTAHAYLFSRTGQSLCAGGTSTIISINDKNLSYRIASDNYSVSVSAKGGPYACASAVNMAVWTDKDGKDDLVWYSAAKSGGVWKATANIHNHREAGVYNLYVYAVVDGQSQCVDTTTFTISSYSDPGVTIYRLYNPSSGEHLYTPDKNERDVLSQKHGWVYEGVGWVAASGGSPVYRLYYPPTGDHHYTMDAYERDTLSSKYGWIYEGIVWYSDGDIPLYRQYNPKLKAGSHHYTMDAYESKIICSKHGWIYEGISWYALREK